MLDPLLAFSQDNKLSTINKNIIEIKKKIQLSEGQRKANFEECDAKIRESCDKIANLKRDIKTLQNKYLRIKNNEDAAENIAPTSRESSATVKKRGLTDAISRVDDDNIRLRKKLDLVKYQSDKQQERLTLLLSDYEELMNGKIQKIIDQKLQNTLKKRIVNLENQLHRMSIMQMEADTVRKKYRSVKTSLKSDAAFYVSSLRNLEKSIKEQNFEIRQLQGVNEEAVELRNTTKETLTQQEMVAMQKSKERDSIILDYRQRVEDRKLELERLERMIFPAIRLPPRGDDFEGAENPEERLEKNGEKPKDEITSIEEAFTKLRSATGVTRNDEVLGRFLGQRATKEKLQKMRNVMEEDKITVEKQRQQLTTEIEMQKFSETKDSDQNAEKLAELNEKISEEYQKQNKYERKNLRIQEIINEIGITISQFCDRLTEISDLPVSSEVDFDQHKDPYRLLRLLDVKLKMAMDTMGGPDQYRQWVADISADQLLDTLSDGSTSEADKYLETTEDRPLFPRFPGSITPAATTVLSEDEEDVPTRSILKRQAQLLVDTKSRRKAFNFRQ